jgi:SAM-dependent methyltransferase
MAGSDAFSPEVYWLAVPAVQKRFCQLGCRKTDYPAWVEYCIGTFLQSDGPVSNMLSIGCGSGSLERDLFRLNAFHHCDAIDIAPAAVETAIREAVSMGARSIDYRVEDVEKTDLPAGRYDAVWFNGSLHHIRELELVCERVRRSLKPNGWLFFNEYVGANHFAFGPQQVEAITHAFGLIPERYRVSFVHGSAGQVQHRVPLPDPIEVVRTDPSEAVRSQDILELVGDYFDIQTINPCGGSLLQFLLHGIAGNFRQEDAHAMRILQMLFDIEDGLIESGVLKSDFIVVAARPR